MVTISDRPLNIHASYILQFLPCYLESEKSKNCVYPEGNYFVIDMFTAAREEKMIIQE